MIDTQTVSLRDTLSHLARPDWSNRLIRDVQTRSLSLPLLSETGFLPEGVHESCLEELAARFATTPFRQDLWHKCVTFLSIAAATDRFTHVYIAGGFVTNKPRPLDVDIILETAAPYGPGAFKAMEPFFARGLDTILVNYSVHLHFWCKGFPDSIWDCRDFFQYLRPFEAFRLGLSPETRKGIVRMRIAAD